MTSSPPEHPYGSFVHLVQKPARYLGGEFGAAVKDWSVGQGARLPRVPRSLRHRDEPPRLQDPLQDPERRPAHARRARVRAVDRHAGELAKRGLPLLSLESARPLCDFDVVGFSLQFELTYTNVLGMLDLGGIPLRARDRGEGDPLVIAGGPTATHPEPLSAFIDAFVIGDGEERTTEIALLWTELKAQGVPRAERLARPRERSAASTSRRSTRPRSIPTRGFEVVDRPLVPEAAAPGRALARRRPEPLPVPRRRPRRRPRGDLRPHVDRDRARLHRGVPLLPGGDDLPPGARARPGADRRDGRERREEERLRRGEPHVALDRGLLVHRAAHQEGRAATRPGEGLARRLEPARLRPRGGRARRSPARARERRDVRPRGGEPADARRGEQERHRRAAHDDRGAHLQPRLDVDEALLHDRPAHRRRERRPRDRPRRRARPRDRQAREEGAQPRRRPQGHGQRLDPRPQAAHAVPVVRDGRRGRRPRRSRAG